MGGWVSAPPPPWGGVGHLSVCGYAKILGGWVPELTPPPPRVAKQNPGHAMSELGFFCQGWSLKMVVEYISATGDSWRIT